MRRITKIGSVAVALLVGVPAFLALDLFGGAEAAGEAPLLRTVPTDGAVLHVAYAETANADGQHVFAYALHKDGRSTLQVRAKGADTGLLYSRDLGAAVSALRIAPDGLTVIAGTLDGYVHLVTSVGGRYDTYVRSDAHSPVTDVDISGDGAWFAAVTYHGDTWLYARERFASGGGAVFHDAAALPANLPGSPDPAEGMLGQVARTSRIDPDFTLRAFSHVALAGEPTTNGNPRGLGIAAATAFGEVYLYDLAGLETTPNGLALRPDIHRVGNAPCEEVDTPSGPFELPCSAAAAARLSARFEALTPSVARPVVAAVGDALQDVLLLTPEDGLAVAQADERLVGFDVTRGEAPAGRHLVAVATAAGSLSLLEARLGAVDDPLRPLWTASAAPLVGLALSQFHPAAGQQAASLLLAYGSGMVEVSNVTASSKRPLRDVAFDVGTVGGSSEIVSFDIARGGASRTDAGRWIALATDDGRMTLLAGQARSEPGKPDVVWSGLNPYGRSHAIDVIDNGGLLVAGPGSPAGLALYAGPVRVEIDAPDSVGKRKPFAARADVSAPDSTVTGYSWDLRAESGAPVRSGSGPTFSHTFDAEGTYRLGLAVTDSFGLKTHASQAVSVGGLRPVLVVNVPDSLTMGNPATFDFTGTHDPDGAGNGTGIAKIELFPFGDMTKMTADVTTMQAVVTFPATGIFHGRFIATDFDGRSTQVVKVLTVTGAGYTLSPADPSGIGSQLRKVVVARDSGTVLSYGGDGGSKGRVSVFDNALAPVLAEGGGAPAGGVHVTSGAITADGSAFVLGRKDGTAVRVPIDEPSQRVVLDVADVPLDWTFLSADGRHAVFATADGNVFGAPGNLSTISGPVSLGAGVVRAVADDRLINLAVQLSDGRIVLLDGHNTHLGVLDEYTPSGTVSTLAMSRDVDLFGRAWLFVGRSDGRVETVRTRSGDFAPLGVATYGSLPVWRIAVGETDAQGVYRLVALTRTTNAACQEACGAIYSVRSDGPKNADNVPVPERQFVLSSQPADVLLSPEGRQVVVVLGSARPSMLRFDSIWDGPVQRMTGLPTWFVDAGMADSGAGYVLLANGQIAWAFAPPLAAFRVGPQNGTGIPDWGARVTALTPTTFDSSPTAQGDGTVVAWDWRLGDGSGSSEGIPVHAYEWRGEYKVRLTVTSQVTYPVETTLVDRVELDLRVYDPAPVAVLSVSPFNETAGAVTVKTGDPVRFDGSGSYDPRGGSLREYRFRFGDNGAQTTLQKQVTYRYNNDGVFYATLTVYDQDDFSGVSGKFKVIVTNRAPEAAFRVTQPEGNESSGFVTYGVPVSFDGSVASDPDGYVVQWAWDFGDGTTGTGENVQHVYAAPGERTVTLRVRDNDGVWSTLLAGTLRVDDGIRLRQTQDPADGGSVGLTRQVTVRGLVHDYTAYPEEGFGVPGAKVRVSVYYDGFGNPSSVPYATTTLVADDAGKVTYQVPFNGAAGLAFEPGRYRVKMIAWWDDSANGDTEWSTRTETTFTAAS